MKLLLALLLGTLTAYAQAVSILPPPTIPYNYFAESGISYDYYGHIPSSTTGFGLRIGSSNTFSVTDVDTAVTSGTTYATLRTGLEYIIATSGRFSLTGIGLAGVTSSSTGTGGSFGGGAGIEYDLGGLLSKGKFSLLVDFQFRITTVVGGPANAVRPTYGLNFRKTF